MYCNIIHYNNTIKIYNKYLLIVVIGWKDGRMEGWKDGRMEGWKDGRMEGWKDGRMEERRI